MGRTFSSVEIIVPIFVEIIRISQDNKNLVRKEKVGTSQNLKMVTKLRFKGKVGGWLVHRSYLLFYVACHWR